MSIRKQRLILEVIQRLPKWRLLQMGGGAPIVLGGRTLDPMTQLFWVKGKRRKPVSELTIKQLRKGIDLSVALSDQKPVRLKSSVLMDIPGPEGPIPIRIDIPKGVSSKAPVFVHYHGGGFVLGGLDTGQAICSRMAHAAKCICVAVDYRLAPEHKFPAGFDDCMAAYVWSQENIEEHGGDPERIAVGGDSAGGMLSAAVAQEAKRRGLTVPILQVLFYPCLIPMANTKSYETYADAFPLSVDSVDWLISHYFDGEIDLKNPIAAPGLAPDLEGLPPALIYTAGFDPLCDEAQDYAERLKDAGVNVKIKRYDSMVHGFVNMAGSVPEARRAVKEIVEDVRVALI